MPADTRRLPIHMPADPEAQTRGRRRSHGRIPPSAARVVMTTTRNFARHASSMASRAAWIFLDSPEAPSYKDGVVHDYAYKHDNSEKPHHRKIKSGEIKSKLHAHKRKRDCDITVQRQNHDSMVPAMTRYARTLARRIATANHRVVSCIFSTCPVNEPIYEGGRSFAASDSTSRARSPSATPRAGSA